MSKLNHVLAAALLSGAFAASPALAQEAAAEPTPVVTVSGSAALVSDYRFRGVSQTDQDMAVQAGITLNHESGFYAGVWGSNLSGWGTFGGSNMELDVFGGYKAKLSDTATLDVGLLWYMYPGGASETDFAEPYAKLTGTSGPLTATAGVAYAPAQQALGKWYANGTAAAAGVYTDAGDKEDNLYLWGDFAYAITGAPLTAKAHIGYSDGNSGLGPNATSVAPTGTYWDYSVGLDATYKNLTLGVSYVGTDISNSDAAYLRPSFSKGQDGTGNIAGGTVLFAVTAAF